MQLFSRRVMLAGPPAELLEFSSHIRQWVSNKIDREIALWSATFGAPLGTMLYAMPVEGLGDMAQISDTLLGDPEYHAELAKGQHLQAAPAEDSLVEVLHGELGEERPPVGSVVVSTTATIATGKYEEAIAWCLDMAQHGEQVTGSPLMFGINRAGQFGNCGFIAVYADGAGADAANAALNADAEYMKKMGDLQGLFVEGSGHRMIGRRVA
jgi:hypothetical protein